MSKCHKKDCHEKRSCWCGIVLVLLGGLILLGLVALIFHFKEPKEPGQQPNSNASVILNLTSNDSSSVFYKDGEPQPVFIRASFSVFPAPTASCNATITLESKNGDISEVIRLDPASGLVQGVTLADKKVTKGTVDVVVDADETCSLSVEVTNGTKF